MRWRKGHSYCKHCGERILRDGREFIHAHGLTCCLASDVGCVDTPVAEPVPDGVATVYDEQGLTQDGFAMVG